VMSDCRAAGRGIVPSSSLPFASSREAEEAVIGLCQKKLLQ
jgi:hypothetical protein